MEASPAIPTSRKMDIPENIRKECSLSFSTEGEIAICIRTSAGLSVARVNADGRSKYLLYGFNLHCPLN
jgi:hypothetical protein